MKKSGKVDKPKDNGFNYNISSLFHKRLHQNNSDEVFYGIKTKYQLNPLTVFWFSNFSNYFFTYIYVCVCVCVCVRMFVCTCACE